MSKRSSVSAKITINGMVQGVGFRPFVYKLAIFHDLAGEIANTSSGVTIHVEGTDSKIRAFVNDLKKKCPPLAGISSIFVSMEPAKGYKSFTIKPSKSMSSRDTLISPDMAMCDDCLKELYDPGNRRFNYPFISCTNCGPRYTIMSDIPCDRHNTSMKHFNMCPECMKEYNDPSDRRFHFQTNGCKLCGPEAFLYRSNRTRVITDDPVKKTAMLLKDGHIVAIKSVGGFHLCVDAENSDAVAGLRTRKNRKTKPFALLSLNLDTVCRFAAAEPSEVILLTSCRRPIVLVKKRKTNSLSPMIAPGTAYFGIMLPSTPLHHLIASHGFTAIVMTSGNISDNPISVDDDEAFESLGFIADYFLIHNRRIYQRCDDSIVRWAGGAVRSIRRSRGYIPAPFLLTDRSPQILACGAGMKNTVCLTKGKNAFLGQHIGDLESVETCLAFESAIDQMKRIFGIDPQIIAYDLHPDYHSTRYALKKEGMKKIGVQHHHAHIASCMAENRIDGQVIGLAFDGTGFGTDGRIWGGEVFIGKMDNFRRAAHLAYIPMPGGSAVVKEPWRMGISYLYNTFGKEFYNLDLPIIAKLNKKEIRFITQMIDKKINTPQTSSLGRLFDGIAAILGIAMTTSYEGEAALALETIIGKEANEHYDYKWEKKENSCCRITVDPIIRGVTDDIKNGLGPPDISRRFHTTIIRLFSGICNLLHNDTGLNCVVLSGGVFQNQVLLKGLKDAVEKKGLQVFTHALFPTNDGGISLGQAVIAASIIRNSIDS
ncbi:MAG TPA: carbamoyltransferase HypF [Desulfobacteraceae bacterium]|nr:carbamoyltransferase HypF [Desulfobacteraceae bacterium]